MPVLHAHSVHIWLTTRDARDRALAVDDPIAHPPSDAFVAIILSAAATEAFINELAELVSMTDYRLSETLTDEQRAFAKVVQEVESERGKLEDKYQL